MKRITILLIVAAMAAAASAQDKVPAHPHIKLETTEGDITLELEGRRAPITVSNFLKLVDSGYFDGTVFHRVVPDFVIQGGGFTPGLELKETEEFIVNESGNGLRNSRGTVAMARRTEPHTAAAQFFINLRDNQSLNPRPERWGYTVFGYVIEGMDVVDRIASLPTGPAGRFDSDVPLVPIVIKKASRVTYDD